MKNTSALIYLFFSIIILGCTETWENASCERIVPSEPVLCSCPVDQVPASAHKKKGSPIPSLRLEQNPVEFCKTKGARFPLCDPLVDVILRKETAEMKKNRENNENRPRHLKTGECIDINLATVEELTALPGIGKGRAQALVASREKKPFKKRSDVTRVKGIGKKMYRRMEPMICEIRG